MHMHLYRSGDEADAAVESFGHKWLVYEFDAECELLL